MVVGQPMKEIEGGERARTTLGKNQGRGGHVFQRRAVVAKFTESHD
jgi:hypothetical protein